MDRHDHDEGLAFDLRTLMARRQALRWLAGVSLTPLLGCAASEMMSSSPTAGSGGTGGSLAAGGTAGGQAGAAAAAGSCMVIPNETGGPYPGDGSNGVNALTMSGIVRSDIRSSFAGMSGTAEGVPLTLKLKLVGVNTSCASLAGYAVYAWHCDRDGNYSLYTTANQNYLRGVQESDDTGSVTFSTIFPGCYSGRWPHIHFQIFPSLSSAVAAGNNVKVSQLALPSEACNVVYASSGYSSSVRNFSQITLASDNVFSDGTALQVADVTGDATKGYVAALTVGLAV